MIAAWWAVIKDFRMLIVARWRSAWSLAALDSGSMPIAFDVEFEDRRMVGEAVDSGEFQGRVWEDTVPFAEELIHSDQDRSPLI